MNSAAFFLYWLAFAGLVLLGTAVAITWAWRAGLFSGQDRARYLALWAEVPKAGEGEDMRSEGFRTNRNNDKAG